jgi:pSer/pThr/pTyr-binding forkhead associated (FHA) protein
MQDKTTIQKRLIGPICCIGRKSDCDIVFNDKTVSRRHLEIRIPTDINVDTLEVIDLNSTFKSYVNEVILVPNSKSIIKSGSILRLGGGKKV